MLTKSKAIELGEGWRSAGWEVTFYPSGLTSRSRQYVPPVLVATRDGWTRLAFKRGPMHETTPDGDTTFVTLA